VRRLTKAAEDVGTSGRLDVEVPGEGRDEVGRLGAAFRQMLGALALSRAEQQRLVQDAGHELRTPLTSLKTNLSVMRRHPDMSPAMQGQILDDLDGEVAELTELVNELVAVASGELVDQPNERLDLVEMATDVAQRVGRRRSREVVVRGAPTLMIDAPRAGLDRAIANIIDNACKFDQTGQPIRVDVTSHDGRATLAVSDHGPGIPEGDIGKVFDRFHRADAARTMPGSGLGLSIVREVVEGIGGSVQAANRDGGGTVIGFSVPDAPRLLPPPSGVPGG
jgi:two-component system sensor histidine kinase MprB